MKVLLNEQEQRALDGLPLLAFCLYVKALKPRLDIATGTIGIKPRISWQALGEWLYVEPHSGVKSGSPSKQQLRRALLWLQKAGLVEQISKKRQLVFKCLLTTPDYYQLKQVGSKLTENSPTQLSKQTIDTLGNIIGDRGNSRQYDFSEPDTHNLTSTNTKLNLVEKCENIFSCTDEEIPVTTEQWAQFFIDTQKFDSKAVYNIKSQAIFEHWCEYQVSIGLVKQAIKVADRINNGKPDTPTYYKNFVLEWLKYGAALKEKATDATKVKQEKKSKVPEWQKPLSSADRMWQSCKDGLKGTDFDMDERL